MGSSEESADLPAVGDLRTSNNFLFINNVNRQLTNTCLNILIANKDKRSLQPHKMHSLYCVCKCPCLVMC